MDHQAFAQLLGNYGEFVGSIAVLATLIYLAFQIRQNNNLASGSAQRELMTGFQDNLDRARSAPKLFQYGLRDFENLSNVDQLEFNCVDWAYWD